jgi:hypothetical protein
MKVVLFESPKHFDVENIRQHNKRHDGFYIKREGRAGVRRVNDRRVCAFDG